MKRFGNYIAIIGADAVRYGDVLAQHCADVLLLPPCMTADRRIACHPDTLTAQIGDTLIVSAAYAAQASDVFSRLERQTDCRIVRAPGVLGARYPADIGCNVLVRGEYLYGLVSHLWPEVTDAAVQKGMTVRSVRQGYAGCSALVCSELVISADPSVLRAVSEDGAQTLSVTPGGIELPGYDCGFIGGASGFCEGTAVFFGSPDRHPDGAKIRKVLESRGMELLPLTDSPLFDGGGIRFLPLREKVSCKEGLVL
ncbi:MAG: hypothetical protein IJD06_01080 [Clostridia bacterium]|nr:hypothetical protein [Clostridia bacterium]